MKRGKGRAQQTACEARHLLHGRVTRARLPELCLEFDKREKGASEAGMSCGAKLNFTTWQKAARRISPGLALFHGIQRAAQLVLSVGCRRLVALQQLQRDGWGQNASLGCQIRESPRRCQAGEVTLAPSPPPSAGRESLRLPVVPRDRCGAYP